MKTFIEIFAQLCCAIAMLVCIIGFRYHSEDIADHVFFAVTSIGLIAQLIINAKRA